MKKNRDGDNILMIIIQAHEKNEEIIYLLFKAINEAVVRSGKSLGSLLNDETEAFNTDGYAVIHLLVKKNLLKVIKYLRENTAMRLNILVSSQAFVSKKHWKKTTKKC